MVVSRHSNYSTIILPNQPYCSRIVKTLTQMTSPYLKLFAIIVYQYSCYNCNYKNTAVRLNPSPIKIQYILLWFDASCDCPYKLSKGCYSCEYAPQNYN